MVFNKSPFSHVNDNDDDVMMMMLKNENSKIESPIQVKDFLFVEINWISFIFKKIATEWNIFILKSHRALTVVIIDER